MPYIVRMKAIHEATGLSAYQVSKQTGVAINTVIRNTETEQVVSRHVSEAVALLSIFYGYKWHDLVEWVDELETPSEETDEEIKTLLATA